MNHEEYGFFSATNATNVFTTKNTKKKIEPRMPRNVSNCCQRIFVSFFFVSFVVKTFVSFVVKKLFLYSPNRRSERGKLFLDCLISSV